MKKYANRRLYDTLSSRYITLEDLAGIVREGEPVRVVDAKSGKDLTNATLAQIVFERREAANHLPVPLLEQLIRLGDGALAEFLGQYVPWALDLYLQSLRTVRGSKIRPANPVQAAMHALMSSAAGEATGEDNELAVLRRELEDLKKAVKKRR